LLQVSSPLNGRERRGGQLRRTDGKAPGVENGSRHKGK
jgi:hypothetical protein